MKMNRVLFYVLAGLLVLLTKPTKFFTLRSGFKEGVNERQR